MPTLMRTRFDCCNSLLFGFTMATTAGAEQLGACRLTGSAVSGCYRLTTRAALAFRETTSCLQAGDDRLQGEEAGTAGVPGLSLTPISGLCISSAADLQHRLSASSLFASRAVRLLLLLGINCLLTLELIAVKAHLNVDLKLNCLFSLL